MPDSSLRVKLCFFFHYHSDFVSRSRMTAELFLFCHDVLICVRTLTPFASQSSALPSEFGGSLQLRKKEIIVFKIYYLIVAIKQ